MTPYKVNDTDSAITYSGNWLRYNSSPFYMGDEIYSNQVGAYAEVSFDGVGIKYITTKDYDLGLADIYIDGELVESVDLYAPSLQGQEEVFSLMGLSDGTHTIKVVVSGNENASAADHYVVIDAFEYYQ